MARRKTIPNKTQTPLSNALFFASVGVTLACVSVVIWFTIGKVPTTEFGYWPRFLIAVILVISVTASLAITEIIPWRSRSFRDWRRPKVLASFLGLIMGAMVLANGLSLVFAPPPAKQETLEEVLDIIKGSDSLIERHIAGVWGEPGCAVTYTVALDNGLLMVESLKSIDGLAALKLKLKAEPGIGVRLVAGVLLPLEQRGDQHEFVYEAAGALEFLTWAIKKREILLKLDRCN